MAFERMVNDMRLIDADAQETTCKNLIENEWNQMVAPVSWASAEERFLERLEEAPTIDAVPVVRCKDCRFDGDEDDCPLLSVAAYTNPDDFCSYGERKEGSDVEGDRGV